MKRREFMTLVGGAAVWPSGARAQQGERVRAEVLTLGKPLTDQRVERPTKFELVSTSRQRKAFG